MSAKILLIDDEESIKIPVEMIITDEGYSFCYAGDGEAGLSIFESEKPDLIILDIMMSKMSGFEVCRKIRSSGSSVPIIILSAKNDIVDKSIGFRAGADDYLVKPFSSLELLLRIEALLRRRTLETQTRDHNSGDTYISGDFEINVKKQEAYVKGRHIELTPKEFKILDHMVSHPDEVFSKEQLQDYVWGKDYCGELTSIAVFIRKIREKIEDEPSAPKYLQTIWGIGYKLTTK